jgi:hypothetical protein
MPGLAPRVVSVAVIYQHPLAYLLAVEGAALLRAFAGEHDRDFTLARIAEVRALVDAAEAWGDGVTLSSMTTPDGYRTWAETYDQPGNQLVDLEQPVVHEILHDLPVGIALDVACGTGRHTRYLAELGHRVIGVDSAQAMLDRAAANVPDASLSRADLHQLPIPDHACSMSPRSLSTARGVKSRATLLRSRLCSSPSFPNISNDHISCSGPSVTPDSASTGIATAPKRGSLRRASTSSSPEKAIIICDSSVQMSVDCASLRSRRSLADTSSANGDFSIGTTYGSRMSDLRINARPRTTAP